MYLLFSMGARGLNPAVVSMGSRRLVLSCAQGFHHCILIFGDFTLWLGINCQAMSTEKYMTALEAAFSRNLLNPLVGGLAKSQIRAEVNNCRDQSRP